MSTRHGFRNSSRELGDVRGDPSRLGRMYARRGSNFANEALENVPQGTQKMFCISKFK
jgi:hypothetical protein